MSVKLEFWKKLALRAAAFVSTLALAVPAVPQGQDQGQKPPTIKTEVTLVNLFATVRDKNKRVITDLKQDNFRIFEDGHEEKVAFFSHEMTIPITLGLLLDTSGSLLSDFTDDKSILDRAINKARINIPGGGYIAGNPGPVGSGNITGTALYDAIYLACGEKLNGEAGRKAIVIVTDAQDEGSKVKLEEAIEAAQRTDTVIHVLLVADPRFGGNGGVARKLADDTGGRVVYVNSEKKLEEAFDQISEELRSQYTLGYYPTNNARAKASTPYREESFRRVKAVPSQRTFWVGVAAHQSCSGD